VLVATGSEVHLALEAKALLEAEEIPTQVSSLPCWELFMSQPDEYCEEVIPPGAMTISVEAGVTLGWERWTSNRANVHGIDRFGASAPYEVLSEEFGMTAETLVSRVKKLLEE
jgi:transketolase